MTDVEHLPDHMNIVNESGDVVHRDDELREDWASDRETSEDETMDTRQEPSRPSDLPQRAAEYDKRLQQEADKHNGDYLIARTVLASKGIIDPDMVEGAPTATDQKAVIAPEEETNTQEANSQPLDLLSSYTSEEAMEVRQDPNFIKLADQLTPIQQRFLLDDILKVKKDVSHPEEQERAIKDIYVRKQARINQGYQPKVSPRRYSKVPMPDRFKSQS